MFTLGVLEAELISNKCDHKLTISSYESVHYFPVKNLLQKSEVFMFEHQFSHEVVGLETKCFWPAQQISFMSSTSLCNLSD